MNPKKWLNLSFTIIVAFIFTIYILPAKVIAFGPSSDKIYDGIDVSVFQGNIDFQKVKEAGIDVVYIKSSEGSGFIDPKFERNYEEAKKNGLKIGFYHYVNARTEEEAIKEAEFFVSAISGKSVDCKLAMDFESFGNLSKAEINRIGLAFIKKVEELSKKEALVYSNSSTASNIWTGEITKYPLWIAQYEVDSPSNNGTWESWVGWQYSDMGEISGIDAYVDRDKYTEGIFQSESSEIPKPENPEPEKPEEPENPEPEKPEDPKPAKTKTIKIKKGDTLYCLAKKYNTTVSQLVELNNIANPNLIYAGAKLIVPIQENTNTQIYVVKSGDTLSKIAKAFNTTVERLKEDNNIKNANLINVNQKLQIRCDYNCDAGHILHTVKRGDTLWAISRRYNTTIANIVMLNRIKNANLIYPGQMFRIR